MKISGRVVADSILDKLQKEIKEGKLNPSLAIILAGNNPSLRSYVNNKIKAAERIGIRADLFEFTKDEQEKCLKSLDKLNSDPTVSGIIIQYPTFKNWNFDDLISRIDPRKDVDGFLEESLFNPATAAGVWEMLSAFAIHEGFKNTEDFLKDKKIVILGKGRTAGGPTIKLIRKKGLEITVIDSRTENPKRIIKNADVIISAAGKKNIINRSNIKKGSYVIGVGVGKEEVDGKSKVYGDINEEEVSKKAKLYCPTIGGIGPLTIACLLRNVVEAASMSSPRMRGSN